MIRIIAGGDKAIRKAVEFAEDNEKLGWDDLKQFDINSNDVVVGIAAWSTTPYVIGAIQKAEENGMVTGISYIQILLWQKLQVTRLHP